MMCENHTTVHGLLILTLPTNLLTKESLCDRRRMLRSLTFVGVMCEKHTTKKAFGTPDLAIQGMPVNLFNNLPSSLPYFDLLCGSKLYLIGFLKLTQDYAGFTQPCRFSDK